MEKLNTSTMQINRAWLMAITSEMALNFNTGLTNRAGSPFAQFRRVFPECPKNKIAALKWANEMLTAMCVKPTNYFTRTLTAASETGKPLVVGRMSVAS